MSVTHAEHARPRHPPPGSDKSTLSRVSWSMAGTPRPEYAYRRAEVLDAHAAEHDGP